MFIHKQLVTGVEGTDNQLYFLVILRNILFQTSVAIFFFINLTSWFRFVFSTCVQCGYTFRALYCRSENLTVFCFN